MKENIRVVCLSDNSISFGSDLWAEHGLSFYIEAEDKAILLDSGQSGDVTLHNAEKLGISLKKVDTIVLSHGHYDHTGGILKILNKIGRVKIYAHPDALENKYSLKDGKTKNIGIPFKQDALKSSVSLTLTKEPVELAGGIYTTGEVRRITSYEGPNPELVVERNGKYLPDPLMDDQSIIIKVKEGLLLLCGCCHSGIINTIETVRQDHGSYPFMIAGGLHMEKAEDKRMRETVKALKGSGVKKVLPGHCSGKEITMRLKEAGIDAADLIAGMHVI
jgi:7,8-dihydropterin-6-yl-methyl-4-(beta-D-ribofuranosyl)aminobenzene 5'-phosphate synthase